MAAIAPAIAPTNEASSSKISESITHTGEIDTATPLSTTPTTITKSTANGSKMSSRTINTVASDKVRLDVLLITGQRKYFDFDPQSNVKEVRESLWQNWPQGEPSYSQCHL